MKKRQTSVCVIGTGNWGTSLAFALRAAGFPLVSIASGRRSIPRAPLTADVLWLCVPDGAIGSVSRRLVQRASALGVSLRGKIVVHSSGALSSQVLEAARQAGARVASVHPVMSFPTRRVVPLEGVSFGIEAGPQSGRLLGALVRAAGGRPFTIKTENKALYHAVGMLSSPLLVSHLFAAQQVAALAGFSPRQARALIEPIAKATLSNVFRRGAAKSFSGPIARGDRETIRLHLQALEPHPMLADLYRSLAVYALEVLPAAGRTGLRKVLRAHEKLNSGASQWRTTKGRP